MKMPCFCSRNFVEGQLLKEKNGYRHCKCLTCGAAITFSSQKNIEALYDELIMAVARHFPGESRHETALRYIREVERNACSEFAVSAKEPR